MSREFMTREVFADEADTLRQVVTLAVGQALDRDTYPDDVDPVIDQSIQSVTEGAGGHAFGTFDLASGVLVAGAVVQRPLGQEWGRGGQAEIAYLAADPQEHHHGWPGLELVRCIEDWARRVRIGRLVAPTDDPRVGNALVRFGYVRDPAHAAYEKTIPRRRRPK